MQFVDKALARRFEACEEMPQVFYARVFQKTRPEVGAAEQSVCGGHMSFCGLGSPIGRAVALGLDRPFTEVDLDEVEAFYGAHKAPPQVDLCPLHGPEVFEMFKQRGYAMAELNNVLYRKLNAAESWPAPPPGCGIRRSSIEEAEVTGAIVERAFFPDGAPEEFRGLISPLYQMEGAVAFVASVEGRLVACWNGAGHRRAQSSCAMRCGHADGISRTRPADGPPAEAHASCRRSWMRIRSHRYERRYHFAAQRGAAGIPRGLQQGDVNQEIGAVTLLR